jgi:hypothetical protein
LETNDLGEYSIVPKFKAGESDEKYPFKTNVGLGQIEVDDIVVNIDGYKHAISGLQISYVQNDNSAEYGGWIQPSTTKYLFNISFAEYNSERKVYPLRVVIDGLAADIALEGESLVPVDFIVAGKLPDLQGIGAFFDIDIPDNFMGTSINIAGGMGRKKLTVHKSSIAMPGGEMELSGTVDWAGDIPSITAKINAKDLTLMQIYPDLYGDGTWVPPTDRPLNIFKDIPLFGKYLHGINFDLDFTVNNMVVYRELAIKNANLVARLKDTIGRVDIVGEFANGKIQSGADVNISADGVLDVIAAGVGSGVSIGSILTSVRENNFISDLPVNFEFYWRANGSDLSGLMATLTGPVFVYSTGEGYAYSDLVSYMYGTDFLTDLRHSVTDMFTSDKKYDQMTINCASANLKFRNGVIETETGVAIETNAINVRMIGSADLATENIRASMVTTPVRGLKLSLTGGVADTLEFVGNMAEPNVQINGGAVVGKVATAAGLGLLLAPFTGGMSVVAGAGVGYFAGDLLENWLADEHPCSTAMNVGAPPRRDDATWMGKPMSELISTVMEIKE